MLDKELLEILVCPKCRAKVHYNDEQTALVCDTCKLAYPIRDDIPVMLVDEAEPLAD
ncbi:MAG: Trm112 family protein [Mariprofundaceae bacterium]